MIRGGAYYAPVRLQPHDPRLRAGLALFEATAAVTATMILAVVVMAVLAPDAVLRIRALATGASSTSTSPSSLLESLAWVMTLQNVVLLLAGMALARWRCPPAEQRVPLLRALAWGAGAGGAAFALAGIVALLQELAGIPVQEQEPLLRALRGIPLVAAFPWVALVAPLGEEVFFRGYVFRFLASRGPLWLAYGASALAFAGIHLNPSGFLVYAVIALVLAFAYRRTGTLLVPFLAHAVHNGITLFVLYAEVVS